jgi:hypothetical protein
MARYARSRVGRAAHWSMARNILGWSSSQPQEVAMPGGPTKPDPPSGQPGTGSDQVREYLQTALRAARAEAVGTGSDPAAVTADLEQRLGRLRRMLADGEQDPPPDDG